MSDSAARSGAGSIAQSAAGDWATTSLALPNPADRRRTVLWSGQAFDLDGKAVRVLAYDVSPSGWTDELTQLHEQTGGSHHFIDVASRRYALGEVIRCAN